MKIILLLTIPLLSSPFTAVHIIVIAKGTIEVGDGDDRLKKKA